jgi:diguanylate cyclase (GGDEF)-like protein
VATLCTSELRGRDIFGRVGGEEFAIVLPETSIAETAEVAERLRARFAAAPIVFTGSAISITASFGVTSLTGADGGFDAMLRRADVALYEAKHGGRNRVVSAALDFTPHPVQAVA